MEAKKERTPRVDGAGLLRRTFALDVFADSRCGGRRRVLASLERPKYYRRARHGYCRGSEPVKYVSDIQTRYGNDTAVVPR